MKAVEFIAKFGWDLAQRDVVCLEAGFITKADFLDHYGFEILDDIKTYVDAWELVKSIGGLVKAKCNIDSVKYNLNAGLFYGQENSNMQAHVERLHDAIALVEEVESLKEIS